MTYLEDLKKLCDAATSGEWAPEDWTQISEDKWVTSIVAKQYYICSITSSDESGTYDAKFIAESRTAIPRLIEALELMMSLPMNVDHLDVTLSNGKRDLITVKEAVTKILEGEL